MSENMENSKVETTEVVNTTNAVNNFKREDYDSYIKELRAESKARRLTLKERETQFKTLLGLDPEADVDFNKAINDFKALQTKKEQDILSQVNNRFIDLELKSKEQDYDLKLLNKLLDRSKITFEDEKVKGLQEQLEELEKEYPSIKKVKSTGETINPAEDGKPEKEMWKDLFKNL